MEPYGYIGDICNKSCISYLILLVGEMACVKFILGAADRKLLRLMQLVKIRMYRSILI